MNRGYTPRITKWQEIKYDKNNRAYIRVRNTRYYLEDCERHRQTVNGVTFTGCWTDTAFSAVLVEFCDGTARTLTVYS